MHQKEKRDMESVFPAGLEQPEGSFRFSGGFRRNGSRTGFRFLRKPGAKTQQKEKHGQNLFFHREPPRLSEFQPRNNRRNKL